MAGRDTSGLQAVNLGRNQTAAGVAFTADLSAVGTVKDDATTNIFSTDQSNILEEERRLIEKVFSIVDKDNSGTIDAKELEEMFKLFGVETHFLTAAIDRVMANADKDRDGLISPTEFYKMLSMKFNKGDSEKDMEDVFDRFGARPATAAIIGKGNKDEMEKEAGIDELHKVALMLGESSMTKMEIKDMIQCFKRLADAAKPKAAVDPQAKQKRTKQANLREAKHYGEEDENNPEYILKLSEFIAIMNMEL